MPSDYLIDVHEPSQSWKPGVPRHTRAGSASVEGRNQRSLDQMCPGPGRRKSQTLISSAAGFARSMVQMQVGDDGTDEVDRPPTKASAGDISKLEKILGVPRKVIARSASGFVDKSNTYAPSNPSPVSGSARSRRAPAPQQMREGIQRFFSDVTLEWEAQAGPKQPFPSSSGEHLRAIVESHLRNSDSSDHGTGLSIDRSVSEKHPYNRTPNSRDPHHAPMQFRSASFSDAVRSPAPATPPQTLPTGPPAPKLKIKVPSHHLSQLMEFPGDKPAPAPNPTPAPEVPSSVVVKRFVLGAGSSAGAHSRSGSQSEAGQGHGRGASFSSVASVVVPPRPSTATSASPKSLNEALYGKPPTSPQISADHDPGGCFSTPSAAAPHPKSPVRNTQRDWEWVVSGHLQ